MNPRQFAEILSARLEKIDGVARVEIAGPGFLNITAGCRRGRRARQEHRRSREPATAPATTLAGQRINLEFVSANPTGPIHLGGTRWAASATRWPRILVAQGADVAREYYFNDHGAQIDRFARSLLAAGQGRASARGRLRRRLHRRHRRRGAGAAPRRARSCRGPAGGIPQPRRGADVHRDQANRCTNSASTSTCTSTRTRCMRTAPSRSCWTTRLRELGHYFETDGAWWLRSTDFGDDKDRVVIKSDGNAGLHRRRHRLLRTSATAASTCASTCSAPTTTATSPG